MQRQKLTDISTTQNITNMLEIRCMRKNRNNQSRIIGIKLKQIWNEKYGVILKCFITKKSQF